MKAAALLLLLFTGLAGAQTVYRCGPDGREYSHEPCKSGKAIDANDARTPAERDAARKVAREDVRLAEQLARERRAREADAKPVGGFDTAPKPEPAASAPKGKKKTSKKKTGAQS